jgi:ArsR family transcriptional regulator
MLANPARLRIVKILEDGERCACEFAPLTGKAQPTISLHLKALESAGIVVSRKDGKRVLYRLKDPRILKMLSLAEQLE